jgi:hypothetical protein
MTAKKVDFAARRREIQQHIATAETEFRAVALRREMEEATDEDLAAARATISTLQDRLTGVDQAEALAEEHAAQRAREHELAERARAYAELQTVLARRHKAAKAVEKAIVTLGSAFQEFRAPAEHVIEMLRPWVRGADLSDLIQDNLKPVGRDDVRVIAGLLFTHGLDFRGFDQAEMVSRLRDPDFRAYSDLASWTQLHNRRVFEAASVIEPEAEQDEAA